MEQKNFEYLTKALDYLGFGSHLNQVLEKAMAQKNMSFSIGFNQRYIPAEFRSGTDQKVDSMHYELKFNRSKSGETYYLGAMDATLNRYNGALPIVKRFEFDNSNRITALQAYKLLCGLSFQKDIFVQDLNDLQENKSKRVTVWYKLDLKVTDQDGVHPLKWFFPEYGYDLAKTFEKYPFLDMDDIQKKESAIKALAYGNLIALSMEVDGKKVPIYVAANPEFKVLDVYSADMVALSKKQLFPDPPSRKTGGPYPSPSSTVD